MADRGIMFSAPMVLALLAGRKTQTRRLATSPLAAAAVGDRFWVRESWAAHWATDNQKPRDITAGLWSIRYFADNFIRPADDGSLALLDQCRKQRPSMFMPRWASRLTLVITGVRTEPLHDMLEGDAIAEGVVCEGRDAEGEWFIVPGCQSASGDYATLAYARLWDSLRPAEGQRWQDNPEVLVLSFDVHQVNIDKL